MSRFVVLHRFPGKTHHDIVPQSLNVGRVTKVTFFETKLEDFTLTFEDHVFDGLPPGTAHRSTDGVIEATTVNRNVSTSYSMNHGGNPVEGRIIVREPPGTSFFKFALALLVGIAVGVAGTILLT